MAGKYLKDKAYEMIREKIVNCELAPGSVLNESELIEEIGASRTPIREALNKLEQENLVTIIPKKCIIVRGITIDDIAEVFDARAVIEPQVLLQYADRISLRFLEDYQERCRTTEDTQELIHLDEDVSDALQSDLLRAAGFTVDGRSTTIYGTCAACGRKRDGHA